MLCKKIMEVRWFTTLNYKISLLNVNEKIYNMNELPIYIDMIKTKHVFYKWLNTKVYITLHWKIRFTVALGVTSSERILKGWINLKKIKKLSKRFIFSNIVGTVFNSCTINKNLVKYWIRSFFNQTNPTIDSNRKLFLMNLFDFH